MQEEQKNNTHNLEDTVLDFWNKEHIFEKSLEKDSPKGEFVFYDGPPFGTGLPHYGHILAGTIKDIIPRYKTMQGYHVRRNWGWDCHGLPVENIIEKELGLNTKKDIIDYGVDKFNTCAQDSVLRYAHEWERIIPRIGRFVDMQNDYKTMDSSYTESIWWVFKSLVDKGLVYEGYKPMHLCPRCETTLSNFEVNQGYKDITDISVYVKFKSVTDENTYFIAWTTTPWTLPGNVALAVGTDIEYAVLALDYADLGKYNIIIAKDRIEHVLKGKEYTVIETKKGSELVGHKYEPIFKDFYNDKDLKNHENGWQIYAADFVTTDAGTGIVHIAPAFGEDDMKLGQQNSLPFVQHVGTNGHIRGVSNFEGMIVKPKENHQATDIEIIKYIAHNHHLFEKEKIIHSYPHCWRCDTPLLNYAATSWFVETTKLKANLLAANQTVSWLPSHIKDGRFGKWLENVRDWAISRSRFWGAPLPVWIGRDSGKKYFIGSVDELKKYTKKSGNQYMIMRHGQSEGNLIEKVSSLKDNNDPLTPDGIQSTIESAKKLDTKIDIIIASPFMRTGQTAELVAKEVGIDVNDIIYDERIGELYAGEFEGKSWRDYHEHMYAHKTKDWYNKKLPGGGESLFDMVYRVSDFLYDIESKYQNKNILFVTHGGPAWGFYVAAGYSLPQNKEYSIKDNFIEGFKKFDNSEIRSFDFVPLPHNQNYEFDLHLPYIDNVNLVAEDGEELVRTPEVFDCWFESGAMPYAQIHYPFENQDLFAKNFPADFIAEGQDQTRGWFYSMLVLGVALFDKSPYKNVIVNGIVLAEDGQKMSKKLKNYPDVLPTVEKYGADALRLYIIGSPVVRGEDMRFSEKDLMQVKSRIVSRLCNVVSFYDLYRDTSIETNAVPVCTNVLDSWIIARLNQTVSLTTVSLDAYELDKPVKEFDSFVDDLSTWYLRRSRDRLKDGDIEAKQTLYFVLKTFARIIAPFAPFVAEDIWQKLKLSTDVISVHLADWPELKDSGWLKNSETKIYYDLGIIHDMKVVREISTVGNSLRKKLNIPLRQPLASFTALNSFGSDYVEIIKDELNVKNILAGAEYGFDTVITPELKKEGNYRELVRALQDMRKEMGLTPDQVVSLEISDNAKDLVDTFMTDLQKTVQIKDVVIEDGQKEIIIDEKVYKVSILY